jgi:glucose-6-phosphate isomerase
VINSAIASRLNLHDGVIEGGSLTQRRLRDLAGGFADAAAYNSAAEQTNPLIYTVSTVEPAQGDGQLHYGLGVLMPGKVGREYYLTKGHYHSWRAAAEVYIGLRGTGLMLLEDHASGETRMLPLVANEIVYVPGHTAHRTINVGADPLVYLGIFPAAAGHDYSPIAERNFRKIVIEQNGKPALIDRDKYPHEQLHHQAHS